MLFLKAKSTIFKTIKDDATGAAKGISVFNSSISTMKGNLSNKQGIFYSIFQGNKLKNSDIDSILNYTNDRDSGKSRIQSFKDNLSGCSVAAQKYIKDAEKANKTTKGNEGDSW